MRILRGVLVLVLFPLALLAQEEVTYTVVMHPALDSLLANVPIQGSETGWCITRFTRSRVPRSDSSRADTVIRVFSVTRAPTSRADRGSVDFTCPPGEPTIHSHPADDDGRVACDASKLDHEYLSAEHRPFGIVWCAAPGTVTFKPWPHDTTDARSKNPLVGQGAFCPVPRTRRCQ